MLGLSSGIACLASCAPVLLPLFLSEAGTVSRTSVLLAQFLAGRLIGYVVFALGAWATGRLVLVHFPESPTLHGSVLLCLGALLGVHSLIRAKSSQGAASFSQTDRCLVSPWKARGWLRRSPALIPAALGLFSGLNLCPPFFVALAQGAVAGSLLGSLLFFAAFFVGTTLFFLPAPLLGLVKNRNAMMQVGTFASAIAAFYFLYSGSLMLLSTPSPV